MSDKHRVVVIGSGFGGLFATKALRRADVQVTLIDRTSHHLFQPLLYQVATGILSEGEIAPPTRDILRRQKNARVLLGTVETIDLEARTVTHTVVDRTTVTPYDSLVVAAGAGQSYFGNDHFAEFAPGMKSIDDALELRGRIFGAYEMAELEDDPLKLDAWLTFVVVGAGPTGVEMAGQIAELSRRTLKGNFRTFDPSTTRVVLLDAADKVLGTFGDDLAEHAKHELEGMGVEVQLGAMVVDVDRYGIVVKDRDGSTRRLESRTKIWAAGVAASPLGEQLAAQSGAELDRSGRVLVQRDLSLPGHPEVYVIGDMMGLDRLPGVSPVAIQGAKHVAKQIRAEAAGRTERKDFQYFDKGSMATISRFRAVASIGRIHLRGFIAWVAWLALHLLYLTAFKNRFTALMHWAVSFIGRGRAERTATYQQVFARTELMKAQRGSVEDRPSIGATSQPLENLSLDSGSQGPPR
ncbi:MAG: putative dehydrogenase [Frankiales bacterium]|jgi:NADH dehydrogenase|nr:putative dehydrogenase [Frankiales bacterium]